MIDDAWFAASNSMRPMPSVTISRARSVPRTTRKLVAKPTQRAGDAGDDKAAERLAPAVHGEKSRGVRADAEERRVPERDDARVAEDQVERHARRVR